MAEKREANFSDDYGYMGKYFRADDSNTFCQNCSELRSYIDAKFKQLSEMMQNQYDSIMKTLGVEAEPMKNEALLESSAQDALLDDTSSSEQPRKLTLNSVVNMFPLLSEEDLVTMDETINDENEELFVMALKSLMRDDIEKRLNAVLCKELVLDCNLDGTHGKTRFKEFKNVLNVLRKVVTSDCNVKDPDVVIRKAFQYSKKFYYKQVSLQRKCNMTS